MRQDGGVDAAGEAAGAGGGTVKARLGRGSIVDVQDMINIEEDMIKKLPHERSLLEREVEHLLASLHATTAGHLSDGYYEMGLFDERGSRYAVFPVTNAPVEGGAVDRLTHSLQSATRAHRDGKDDEYVVCALIHDIGDTLASVNHSELAATILEPFVSEKNHWIVKHHGVFQGYYYFHHYGQDRDARERYRGHEYYAACVEFCARWDQVSFDPDYETLPLEHFEPLVRAVFAREPRPHV